jgi:hypothetical protein
MFIPKTRKNKLVKEWVNRVKQRDDYKCKKCGSITKLVAHHIIPWEIKPELRLDLNNGITLCIGCHMRHHKNHKGKKGQIPWNKGLKGLSTGWKKGNKRSAENIEKMRQNMLGKPSKIKGIPKKKSTKKLISQSLKGKMSEDHKEKCRKLVKGKTWIIDPDSGKRKWIDKD